MFKQSLFENMIEEKLLGLRTAYIAKVVSLKGNTATVQPMTMIKQYGKPAQKAKVVSDVPILSNAKYKFVNEDTEPIELKPVPISAGDLVLCVCCDRDITEARRGNIATPQIRHHSLSDSVIVGIL